MKSDFWLEFKRQMVHLLLGSAIAFTMYFFKLYTVLLLLATTILFLVVPRFSPNNPLSRLLMALFERKKDIEEFPFRGAIFFNIGAVSAVFLLPLEFACGVILVLGWGDSMSTLIGKYIGRHRIGAKSIEGSLAFLLFGFIGALFFLNWEMALLFAFVGMFIELFLPFNDNLSIPIGLSLLYYVFSSISSFLRW
ncbi:diacylglycerol/polyprenol kinase family protein [Candidatus Altiarchaeota archaeon]